MDIDLKQLRELLRALKQFDVTHFSIEQEGVRIEIGRGHMRGDAAATTTVTTAVPVTQGGHPEPSPAPLAKSRLEADEDPNVVYVTSPFVGTFYRAPDPNANPFVEPGQDVRAGQVLCIVEAMKLMNEIETEFDCTILDVLVETGSSVEYGDRLFKVRKR